MTDLATAEFEARIRHARTSIEARSKTLPSVANPGIALLNLACGWITIALANTYLKRYEEARFAYGQSALALSALLDRDAKAPAGANAKYALEAAILSSDEGTLASCLGKVSAGNWEDLTPVGRGYLRALRSLAKGDQEGAKAAANELKDVPDPDAEKVKFYPGLGSLVSAIISLSPDRVRAGLERVLETHVRYAKRGHLRRQEASLLCTPASCLVALALKRGIPVSVDPRYHAVPIKLPVTHLEQWQGQPTAGRQLEVLADMLPLGLLR